MVKITLVTRIDKVEKAVMGTAHGTCSSDCNCFPEDEQPFFCSIEEEEIASKLKCPIHGTRFTQPIFRVYVPQWRRNSEPERRQRLSAQYRKAWELSFPE
jgi:hypothetical protein